MADEMNAVLDALDSASTPDVDATNPATDDDIEALGYPYADDPRYAGEADEGQAKETDDASTGESAPDGEPTEAKTDEEKALDDEIKRLQAENPQGLPRHLRQVATGALRGKREAEARVTELESELESERGVSFRPNVPVDEFDARKFNHDLVENHAPYYGAIATDIIRTHLDPIEMAKNPAYMEPVMPLLQEVFTSRWLPNFIQQTYGMDMETFAARVDQAFSGQPAGQSPTANSSQQIITEYGLEPGKHDSLITALQRGDQRDVQLAQLQRTVQQLQEAQGNGTKQAQASQEAERLQSFESMVSSDRQRLLETALQSLPRDATGQIKKEFAHLPKKIERLVKSELDEDVNYGARYGHAEKWFKQPGNAETAKRLAAGDMKAIFGTHQAIIQRIASEELAPFASLIRANRQIEQTQRAQNPVRGGQSPSHVPPPASALTGQRQRPLTLAERATRAYDASRSQ